MYVFSSHSFWTSSSLDLPAGVTQEEGHTGFFIHLPSAVRVLIFLARRIQPFLSLVDREVEFCVLTISWFSTRWALFLFFFSEKNPAYRDRTHVPTCQKVTRLPLSYRGDRLAASILRETTMFVFFWIMLKTSDLPVALFAFFNSLTQTFWFYRYIYLYLIHSSCVYVTCKSIIDATSNLRLLPLYQFL